MSVKSKPGTWSQAVSSKISETTKPEDKGQNRHVIEWLERVDADRPFLRAGDTTWSYGEALVEVRRRSTPAARLSSPSLTPASVFDVVAGLASGGVTVVGPQPETTDVGEDAELVVFTSGSSGRPKGVRLTRGNLEAAASASAAHLGHGPEDDWLLAMPLHHVGGLSIVVRQMFTGGSITMLPSFDAVEFASAMKGGVTMVSVVPTMLRRVLEHGPFAGLRAVLVGGGPIPEGLLEEGAAAGLPVLPTYGMTETFGQVATLRPGSPLDHRAHPLPGVELRITSDGLIAVRGDQVSPGYEGEPDRPDPWFLTSDLGELDEGGALRVLGRADTVIVTGGENVDPERVEAVLREHGSLEEFVVVGVPDEQWGQVVVCLYAGDADIPVLETFCSERLPRFMVPKKWVAIDAIPRTSLGKPDRRAAASSLGGDG